MKMNKLFSKDWIIIVSLLIIFVTALIIRFDDGSQFVSILRIIFGWISLLFLPWRWMTNVFFSKKEIDWIERFALSFALSISVIPLIVFYTNLAGVPITEWLVLSVVLIIVLLCVLHIVFFPKKSSEKID